MSYNHSHGGCGDECHDHDIPEAEGPRDNLYLRIDKQNTVALNAENGAGPEVIKPWHERMDEEVVSATKQTCCITLLNVLYAVP